MFDDDGPPLMLEREAGPNVRETDSPVAVRFFDGTRPDPKASEEHDRPMVKPCVRIEIIVPGQSLEVYNQPATELHKKRFPQNWKRYLDGNKPLEEGHTPLSAFPHVTRADIINFRSLGVHSVEMLAAVNDDNLSRLGYGARELQTKARAWLAAAKDSSVAVKLAADSKRKDDQIAALTAQMAAMQEQFDAMKAGAEAPAGKKKAA